MKKETSYKIKFYLLIALYIAGIINLAIGQIFLGLVLVILGLAATYIQNTKYGGF